MFDDDSAPQVRLMSAAKKEALFQVATDQLSIAEPVLKGRAAGGVRILVEVELIASSSGSEFRQLGSLAERHGMRIHPCQPSSQRTGGVRASVAVPRAKTQREAEEAVASLLEWLPSPVRVDEMPPTALRRSMTSRATPAIPAHQVE